MVDHLRFELREIAARNDRDLYDAEQALQQRCHFVVNGSLALRQRTVKVEYDQALQEASLV